MNKEEKVGLLMQWDRLNGRGEREVNVSEGKSRMESSATFAGLQDAGAKHMPDRPPHHTRTPGRNNSREVTVKESS